MKYHFITLFDPIHKKTTLILLTIALLLIVISLTWGLTDNLPAIAMIFVGIMLFYFAIIHPWKKVIYYVTFIAVCGTILPLVWGNRTLGEFIDFTVGGLCVAGIIAGIIGIFIRLLVNLAQKQ